MTRYPEILAQVRSLSDSVTLVAVSKTVEPERIFEAYGEGCRDFGENRVQEALPKIDALPKDIRWHLIGTLQKKKVRKVLGRFALIHSVDTPELAEKISAVAQELGVVQAVLLQVNVSGEESKHGCGVDQWLERMEAVYALPGLEVQGLMTMAPADVSEAEVLQCFAVLREFRDKCRDLLADTAALPELSMGMSGDFAEAIREGATLVRIGSAIFS